MDRRAFIGSVASGLLAMPLIAFAQAQSKVWRIGFLAQRRLLVALESDPYGAFAQGMRELGYVEGKNLLIEYRFAEGEVERLPGLAAELVQLKVDVIVAASTSTTSAAQKATSTIPIVMGSVSDPVGSGFVKTLARPGGNITGLSNLTGDLSSKHLEMVRSIVPTLSCVAVLVTPANSSHIVILKNINTAAQMAAVRVVPMEVHTPQEIEKALLKMIQENVGAVIIAQDAFFTQQLRQIAELMAKHRLPSLYALREYAEAGGLMSYGGNLSDNYRHAAKYVDAILKGAKPADLPVQQPTILQLVINLRTAKVLGITVPQSLLLRADEVIQ